ncbi:MAG TPA: PilZ domain-containing protein [Polyangiaceae bacterium]
MSEVQERRAKGTSRVPLETLVEIVGNEPGIPAFEAEAVDVSARGMHVRTAYLPEQGAPLVCRFEDQGREIVVEGVVAWRKESAKGGDFGVTFTALDSRSVDALRGLVKVNQGEGDDAESSQGSRVRLHIEGLGSPMKARVRSGGVQKVQVGSSLEFLKVGRKLEIEDLEAGGRRVAHIDGVEIVVDARTSVPQLVVALRYEGVVEDTPVPTVTDLGAESAPAAGFRIDPDAVTTDAESKSDDAPTPSGDVPAASDDDDDDQSVPARAAAADDDDDVNAAVPATTRAARRLGHAAENAGTAARDASVAAARLGSSAWKGMGKLLGGATAKIAALRTQRSAQPRRRTTAPAPEGPVSLEGKRLRPQSAARVSESGESAPAPKKRLQKRIAAGAAAAALLATVGAFGLKGGSAPEKKAAATDAVQAEAPLGQAPAAAARTASSAGPVALSGSPVSANVPLFGPTPLATLEPAPLGPPPSAEAQAVEESEMLAAKAASPARVADEEFPEPIERASGADAKKSGDAKDRPEDVAPWGRGKMHLPTIQRLRLDAPGSAIHGEADPTGFTVLVPGRKLMEQGNAIAKRDPRIARVRTTNTPGGAQVRMAFRDGVPGYRVRLRRDYIELLISAPEEKPKATVKDAAVKSKDVKDAKLVTDVKDAKPAKPAKSVAARPVRD